MHIGRVYRATFSIGFCLAALVSFAADRAEFSGFLGDYSQLESVTDRYVDYVYSVPDFRTRMAPPDPKYTWPPDTAEEYTGP